MLRVVCGPMFAGKSTTLLRDSMDIDEDKKMVIKPKTDTRNSGFITIHGGIMVPAIEMDIDHGSICGLLNLRKDVEHIFIDEIQFFQSWMVRDIQRVLFSFDKNITVNVYGLDLKYDLGPWPIMRELLPLADEVVKLKSNCSVCNEPATKTIRKIASSIDVIIGQGDSYEPRCNGHTK